MLFKRTFRIFALEKSLPNKSHTVILINCLFLLRRLRFLYSSNAAILFLAFFVSLLPVFVLLFSFCCLSFYPLNSLFCLSLSLRSFLAIIFYLLLISIAHSAPSPSFIRLHTIVLSASFYCDQKFFSLSMPKIVKLLFYDLIHLNAFAR